jgi:hypothetical protein
LFRLDFKFAYNFFRDFIVVVGARRVHW